MSSVTSRIQRFWKQPSRILLAEESILATAVVAAGLLYLFAWLPKPIVPSAATEAVQQVKSSFARRPRTEQGLSLMAASRPMMRAIRHAKELEAGGVFNETTCAAWKAAGEEVRKLSALPIATTNGHVIRLWMRGTEEERVVALEECLEEMLPGRFAALEEQRRVAVEADPSLDASLPPVTWYAVAADAPDDMRESAYNLCHLRMEARDMAALIAKYRDIVGYDHWKAACAVGETEAGVQSHAAMWRANYGALMSQFDLAKDAYEEGFRAWRTVCDASPEMRTDRLLAEEMQEHFERYRDVLASLPEPAASPVLLQDLIGGSEPVAL